MMTSRCLEVADCAVSVSGCFAAFDPWFNCWLIAMRRSRGDKLDMSIFCSQDHMSHLRSRRNVSQGCKGTTNSNSMAWRGAIIWY